MKFLICFAMFVGVSVAQAQWFPANGYVTFNNVQAQVQVYNNWGRTIYCQGSVTGVTYYGQWYSYPMNTYIYPGNYGYAYVNTTYANPFVNAWSNISCRYW